MSTTISGGGIMKLRVVTKLRVGIESERKSMVCKAIFSRFTLSELHLLVCCGRR